MNQSIASKLKSKFFQSSSNNNNTNSLHNTKNYNDNNNNNEQEHPIYNTEKDNSKQSYRARKFSDQILEHDLSSNHLTPCDIQGVKSAQLSSAHNYKQTCASSNSSKCQQRVASNDSSKSVLNRHTTGVINQSRAVSNENTCITAINASNMIDSSKSIDSTTYSPNLKVIEIQEVENQLRIYGNNTQQTHIPIEEASPDRVEIKPSKIKSLRSLITFPDISFKPKENAQTFPSSYFSVTSPEHILRSSKSPDMQKEIDSVEGYEKIKDFTLSIIIPNSTKNSKFLDISPIISSSSSKSGLIPKSPSTLQTNDSLYKEERNTNTLEVVIPDGIIDPSQHNIDGPSFLKSNGVQHLDPSFKKSPESSYEREVQNNFIKTFSAEYSNSASLNLKSSQDSSPMPFFFDDFCKNIIKTSGESNYPGYPKFRTRSRTIDVANCLRNDRKIAGKTGSNYFSRASDSLVFQPNPKERIRRKSFDDSLLYRMLDKKKNSSFGKIVLPNIPTSIELAPVRRATADEAIFDREIKKRLSVKLRPYSKTISDPNKIPATIIQSVGDSGRKADISSATLTRLTIGSSQERFTENLLPSNFHQSKSSQNSSSSSISTNSKTSGTIPFHPPPNPNSTYSLKKKRSSSLVNAISNLVNLRSSNISTSRSAQPIPSKLKETSRQLPTPPIPSENDTFNDYLIKISPYQKSIGVILTEKDEPFRRDCLNHFLKNHFNIEGLPLDIALRELLMFLDLPKETQQIDRLLIAFSEVFFEKNMDLDPFSPWLNKEQVYFIAFSLLMLHTDHFNPNNKTKLSKNDFLNMIHGDIDSNGNMIPKSVIIYFYENICAKEASKFEVIGSDITSMEDDLEVFIPEDTSLSCVKTSNNESIYSPVHLLKDGKIRRHDSFTSGTISAGGIWKNRSASTSLTSYIPYIPSGSSQLNSPSTSVMDTNSVLEFPFKNSLDIYSFILANRLQEINMKTAVDKFWDVTRVLPSHSQNEIKDSIDYRKLFSILNEVKGGYLKMKREDFHKICVSKFEIVNPIEKTNRNNDNLYLKIVQMGEVAELNRDKKFSLVGNSNKMVWKKKFAILTSYALLVFDQGDWIKPQSVYDMDTGTTNYIIDFNSSLSSNAMTVCNLNSLFAVKEMNELGKSHFFQFSVLKGLWNDSINWDLENSEHKFHQETNNEQDILNYLSKENSRILFLHTLKERFVWLCSSQSNRNYWINSINMLSAHDGCLFYPGSFHNQILSARKHNIDERIKTLYYNKQNKSKKLFGMEKELSFYRYAIPIQSKTRVAINSQIRGLAIRMDWLLYEIKRNEVYINILKIIQNPKNNILDTEENFENRMIHSRSNSINSLGQSFIFADNNLHKCITDDEMVSINPTLDMENEDIFTFK